MLSPTHIEVKGVSGVSGRRQRQCQRQVSATGVSDRATATHCLFTLDFSSARLVAFREFSSFSFRNMRPVTSPNPILDFGIDTSALCYAGRDLQRPECILAERYGTLWSADARGGVVQIRPDGGQTLITQVCSAQFSEASSERYLHGTLPNGMAFARNGNFLIANFGTDCLEVMTRAGDSRVLADTIDGPPIGKVNFVLRDSRDRVWVTISTRIKNWMHALRTDLEDGYIALYEGSKFRIVADDFGFTNEIRFDERRIPVRGRDYRRMHQTPPAERKWRPR
jgi:hypothetical protein